jgi:hypothetical protein
MKHEAEHLGDTANRFHGKQYLLWREDAQIVLTQRIGFAHHVLHMARSNIPFIIG